MTAATNGATVHVEESLPPHDLGAERIVLGAMLTRPEAIDDLLDTLPPASHYEPRHQVIHHAILDLHRRGNPVDPISVADELRRRDELTRSGGAPYLITLMAAVPTASNVAYYGEIVQEMAGFRRLQELGTRLQQLGRVATGDIDSILARAQQSVAEIGTSVRAAGHDRLVGGGSFIHDISDVVPALWGRDDQVLWAEGEPLMLTGPTGVGKTTVAGQLVAARCGFSDSALGFPVAPGRRLLYLAMDRPAQIQRALRRRFRTFDRDLLDERLVVWKGPPPADLAREPERLLELAERAGADTVVVDSLKDAAVKLSDEEVGQGINRAFQLCVSHHVEVAVLHHQRKSGAGGQGKPTTIADVYGSAWITAGCGSILLLWGAAGDLVVELSHLKQPATVVGPLSLTHDHDSGVTAVSDEFDILAMLKFSPRTIADLATMRYGNGADRSQQARIRRQVTSLVQAGVVELLDEAGRGGSGSFQGGRYAAVEGR